MTQIFLCRHAEVEDLYHKKFGGTIDMALSARGHTQAQALASWMIRHSFDAVYASPMQRVQLTLEPLPAPILRHARAGGRFARGRLWRVDGLRLG